MAHANGFNPLSLPAAQPAPVAVASPFNDVQILSFVAALTGLPTTDAVDRAFEIVADVQIRMQNGDLAKAFQARREQG